MTKTATPREHVNAAQQEPYKPQHAPVRPGAEAALQIPSRMGNTLRYCDGRVEKINE